MGEKGQNTNLASEFYVLSMLYRLGLNPNLTLGNKKSVDIIIEKGEEVITIDVKGLSGATGFPLDNWKKIGNNHFLIFVSFLNKISDPYFIPEVYIVPSKDIQSMIYKNPKGNRKGITLSKLREFREKYYYMWDYFK